MTGNSNNKGCLGWESACKTLDKKEKETEVSRTLVQRFKTKKIGYKKSEEIEINKAIFQTFNC